MMPVLQHRAWIPAGLALLLVAVNASVWQKETLIDQGRTVLLQLAPVDPRSLMQGDYMRLDYALTRALPRDQDLATRVARLKLDLRQVATRIDADSDAPLGADEARMVMRRRGGVFGNHWRIGSDAYFFQEGGAAQYNQARFGEYRTSPAGDSVLIALRDEQLRRIGVNRLEHHWRVPRTLPSKRP
jgi:uncharacterized membrane-anchored protein